MVHKYKGFFSKHCQLSKYKHLEIETCLDNSKLFSIECSWTIRHDHAGFRFNVNLIGWEFSLNVYDSRHWDYANDCWKESIENKKPSHDMT